MCRAGALRPVSSFITRLFYRSSRRRQAGALGQRDDSVEKIERCALRADGGGGYGVARPASLFIRCSLCRRETGSLQASSFIALSLFS